ncbi:MAG: glycosyltransferase family 2 protein [Pseudomonadota bacterium]
MTATCPISAFIITRDEEQRLPRTLEALSWVDEIVVVDSGSTDRTVEIAEAAGARVLHRDWTGYGPQKVFAEAACRHDWVLNVDADEVVTPALAREISGLFASGLPSPGGWRMPILTVYPGAEGPRPFAADFNELRLYHRSIAGYRDHPVYDRVETAAGAQVSQLMQPVWHFTVLGWAEFVEKENRHSSFLASNQTHRRSGLGARIFVEMPWTFLKFYLLRRHITGGWRGFFFALTAAYARTLRIAKMLEAQNDPDRQAPKSTQAGDERTDLR